MDFMSSKQFFFRSNEEKLLPSCKRHCISVGMVIFDKFINHLFLENSADCSFEIEKEDGLMFRTIIIVKHP